ncbi:FecR domain-containing protein [Microbulbifer bruguierae]|uniref:FecR domain-containing protein n=1 Tax=Microbulbifer bruguierae TaxID=3029061 RepID=A0ABY8NB39_9GAMM|nr:FecR domain-containing protein [Microbulbifer bruguierae]WGL15619.1 FecR domain-containing protein [Microbulbifer bruguierae]
MATGNSQQRIDIRKVETEALEWFLLHSERELGDSEQFAFDTWMSQLHNRASYQRLQQIDRSLAAIAATEEGARLRQRSGFAGVWATLNNYFGIAPISGFAFACTLMLAVGVAYLAPWHGEPAPRSYASELAQVRTVILEDGSQVTLGGDSAIETDFSGERRHVKLLRGQAFFAVAKDASRPFLVNAQGTEIRVVGTRFDVNAGSRLNPEVKVTVEEGIVDVARSPVQPEDTAPKVRLTAGQQVRVDARQLSRISTVENTEVASWRQGKFSYRDAPLSEVVADANRYRKDRIIIGTRELEKLRVTTAFTADQADTLVAMLEQSLPVRVFKEPDGRVVIWPGTVE